MHVLDIVPGTICGYCPEGVTSMAIHVPSAGEFQEWEKHEESIPEAKWSA